MPDFDPRPPSAVREESPFVVPPRVRVVAVEERVPEAVALAEELDRRGAEAEVRLAADAATAGSAAGRVPPGSTSLCRGPWTRPRYWATWRSGCPTREPERHAGCILVGHTGCRADKPGRRPDPRSVP